MPKYDVKCTVMRDGEPLTGQGVELPKETGDRLVARKLASPSAGGQSEPKQETKGGSNKATGGQSGDGKGGQGKE